jgi:hypothetical protein
MGLLNQIIIKSILKRASTNESKLLVLHLGFPPINFLPCSLFRSPHYFDHSHLPLVNYVNGSGGNLNRAALVFTTRKMRTFAANLDGSRPLAVIAHLRGFTVQRCYFNQTVNFWGSNTRKNSTPTSAESHPLHDQQ